MFLNISNLYFKNLLHSIKSNILISYIKFIWFNGVLQLIMESYSKSGKSDYICGLF